MGRGWNWAGPGWAWLSLLLLVLGLEVECSGQGMEGVLAAGPGPPSCRSCGPRMLLSWTQTTGRDDVAVQAWHPPPPNSSASAVPNSKFFPPAHPCPPTCPPPPQQPLTPPSPALTHPPGHQESIPHSAHLAHRIRLLLGLLCGLCLELESAHSMLARLHQARAAVEERWSLFKVGVMSGLALQLAAPRQHV